MRQQLKSDLDITLSLIDSEIIQNIDSLDRPGLMSGKMGVCLFLFHRYQNTKREVFLEKLEVLLSDVFHDLSDGKVNMTLADGLSGILWGINYLEKKQVLEETNVLSNELKEALSKFIENELNIMNWDYLHGGLGGFLAMDRKQNDFKKKIVKILDETKTEHSDFIYWKSLKYGNDINLGLSHGQTSILYFLQKIIISGVSNEKTALKLLKGSCYYILDKMNKDYNSEYLFDSFVSVTQKSRLAWCYGDLSIGYMLLSASKLLKDENIEKKAISILLHTTKRRTLEDTMIIDSCICHGTTGLVLLYNKLFNMTEMECFKESSDFWLANTIKIINEKELMFYRRVEDIWANDYSLLEGLSGVGLALSSLKTNTNHEWTSCLLLN